MTRMACINTSTISFLTSARWYSADVIAAKEQRAKSKESVDSIFLVGTHLAPSQGSHAGARQDRTCFLGPRSATSNPKNE